MTSPLPPLPRYARLALSTLPLLVLLLLAVLHGAGDKVHNILLRMGESRWEQYATLRVDPEKPTCDANEAAVEAAPAADEDDLFADPEASDESRTAALKECKDRHAQYEALSSRITDDVRSFRQKELAVAWFVEYGITHSRHLIVLILLICGVTATVFRQHIGLRSALTVLEDRVSNGAQLIANALLLVSFVSLKNVYDTSSGIAEGASLLPLWIIGFGAMSAANLYHIIRPAPDLARTGGTIGSALVSVPLYVNMTFISIGYFLWKEDGYFPGIAIYLQALLDSAILYIHVALYIWIGMLLKNTRLAGLIFDVIRPLKLPPEILAVVVVAGSAIPTAFSGASGIFVIAVGAIVYREMLASGARRQVAIATTAMSGSLGVVLQPCLLVVIVAALNYKHVTTDELFEKGRYVYLLSATIFAIAAAILFMRSDSKFSFAALREAPRASGRALMKLVPYVLAGVAVWAGYRYGLDTPMDEHSAPTMLPVIMLAILAYDRFAARREVRKTLPSGDLAPREPGLAHSLAESTEEAAGHIGGLLSLMGLSICFGAVIERADLMSLFPQHFSSPFTTMALLVVIKVILGMLMDPYGACILVSQTLAPIAYQNGIDPIHFWMMVLTAFELGYLLPPIALNLILTRKVIGEAEYQLSKTEGDTWWRKRERVLLPLVVMGPVLLIVAFGPLIW